MFDDSWHIPGIFYIIVNNLEHVLNTLYAEDDTMIFKSTFADGRTARNNIRFGR